MNKMNGRYYTRSRQGGFTLVEIAIVVVFIALLMIGAAAAPRITAGIRANKESDNLRAMYTAVQKKFSERPNFSTFNDAYVISFDLAPAEMINGAALQNRWGGTVVAAPTTFTNANDAFQWTHTGIPTRECKALGLELGTTYDRITINGTVVKTPGAAVTETAVATQCDSTNSNTMIFAGSK